MVDPALQRSALVQERTRGDLRPPGGVAWQPQVSANHSGTAGESGQNPGSSSRFTYFFPRSLHTLISLYTFSTWLSCCPYACCCYCLYKSSHKVYVAMMQLWICLCPFTKHAFQRTHSQIQEMFSTKVDIHMYSTNDQCPHTPRQKYTV